jgi:hypothetical protein
MRLLNTASRKLEEFGSSDIPLYAILSHTWGGNEITFQDIEGANAEKSWDMKKLETPAPWPRLTGLITFGSTLAALIRQAAQSSPKRSTLCIVGTKNPECATHILTMCR